MDKATLKRLYVDEKMTTRQIAELSEFSPSTIARRLHQYGIEPRIQGAERIKELQDEQWVREHYLDKRKSTVQIAVELGCTSRTVYAALERFGIQPRPRGQNKGKVFSKAVRARMSAAKKGKLRGSSNPNWRGGYVDPTARERRSYKAKAWRKAVYERDNHKCCHCGNTDDLHAHHIKAWKDYPELRFDVSNGKTLCAPCHQEEHGFPFPKWVFRNGEKTTSAVPSKEVKI